jgi:isocitrate lyase
MDWKTNPRWKGVVRPYTADDVKRLRGTLEVKHTVAEHGAVLLWKLFQENDHIPALGAITGHQAVQMVQAGLKAIYVSGWQVAGDNNAAGETYPDQSLYPADSVPMLVRRINNAFKREDEKQTTFKTPLKDWFAPLVADAEAGFGGPLNAYELMKWMIEAGAAGVHFEDQLSSAKKCGHLGGKVLVPIREFVQKLIAARLAADVANVPTIIVARTDAYSAKLITSDIDPLDAPYIKKERTEEGFFTYDGGLPSCITRALAYAPYADLLWFETSTPNMDDAKKFAEAVHKKFPGKYLAYNCSPSFNWSAKLDAGQIAKFQKELGALGYKFQFVTLAGFHVLNHSMFKLAHAYGKTGMTAYNEVQQAEFKSKPEGYMASEHQGFVGVEYFDEISKIISGGKASTVAMEGSTEKDQFK